MSIADAMNPGTFEPFPDRYEIHPGEARRQKLWLDALEFGSRSTVRVIRGYYDQHDDKPRLEKQTDTNLAISMIRDAIMSRNDPRLSELKGQDTFEHCHCVLLVSGDNDFRPVAEMIANFGVDVAIFRPMGAKSDLPDPVQQRIRFFDINEDELRASNLPDRIPRKRGDPITWESYLELRRMIDEISPEVDREMLARCQSEASKSDDKETKVGCVVRNGEGRVVATGNNALPRDIRSVPPERMLRPNKYSYIEHAERNAIYNAARNYSTP